MKAVLQLAAILCFVSVPRLQAENMSLESLEMKIISVVNQFFPEKSVDHKHQDGEVMIARSTMPFQIHNIDKTGKVAEKPHQEIGPKADGFSIVLTHQPGPYRGAAVYPQTFIRPYWKTFGTVIPMDANQNHIHVSFSYGVRVPEEFVASVIKNLKSDE